MNKQSREESIFQAIENVKSLTTVGLREGRDTILKYLEKAHINQNRLKVFHVAGSNGKGSVCHMFAQVLGKQFDKKVGLFTSPHLVDITERFQINGVQISPERLNTYYTRILDQASTWGLRLSFFEIQVITAVMFFLDEEVDFAVFEVGLGGMLDGTNIWSNPVATYITSIALEHQFVLGKTRSSILRNKLGIAKKGSPLFTPFDNQIIRNYCRKIGTIHRTIKYELFRKKNDEPAFAKATSGRRGTMNDELTNLAGKHQQRNALLVLTSLKYLGYDEKKICTGLQEILVPGRLQWIHPRVLVDTANNSESLQAVIQTLGRDFFDDPNMCVIFGSTQINGDFIVELINKIPTKKLIFVGGFHRAHNPEDYRDKIGGEIQAYLTIEQAFSSVFSSTNTSFFVVGSLYLVGETIKYFQNKK